MSIRAMNWAWSVPGLRPVQRLVLLAIADRADDAGYAWPNQDEIAAKACCSVRTARRALDAMEEREVFSRGVRYLEGVRTSSWYRLNFDYRPNLPVEAYRSNEVTLPAKNAHLTGHGCPPNHQNHQNHHNPSIVSPLGEAVTDGTGVVAPAQIANDDVAGEAVVSDADVVEEAFNSFWAVYPRKVGKAKARTAFMKAVERAGDGRIVFSGVRVVLDGAARFAADPNMPEKQFIPHPATWLNRDGWEDEPLPARGGGVLDVGRAVHEQLSADAAAALEAGARRALGGGSR